MDNGNEPAYPLTEDSPRTGPRTWLGLTKREYFAAMAMQGMTSNNSITNHYFGPLPSHNFQPGPCSDACGHDRTTGEKA